MINCISLYLYEKIENININIKSGLSIACTTNRTELIDMVYQFKIIEKINNDIFKLKMI